MEILIDVGFVCEMKWDRENFNFGNVFLNYFSFGWVVCLVGGVVGEVGGWRIVWEKNFVVGGMCVFFNFKGFEI